MALDNAPSWQPWLNAEFEAPYMQQLKQFLQQQKAAKKKIYPHSTHWFHALEATPLDRVKVVIIGQDPYHQPGQAHGLCFSVRPGIKTPPSLVNIYKELHSDLGVTPVDHGYLESWAKQGVLLLNAVLTVEDSQAASHQGKGWEQFTDRVIATVNEQCEHVVFLLWGSYAQKKGAVIDPQRHLVLKSAHPSPLAAYRGFFGCKHFSQANEYLQSCGRDPIDWQLPGEISS
ncbi:Uracil-DNA glycosylase [Amphritea atlantica]|uniref:Uracil-DNA glycosylase n=1 Tax=Amphritea atlantica TaxID=355243 RepID=A0A1H9L1E9_9GAMM|nr:uracil-DNA glycosylase [Amphritea atlantica]SER05089.1 Uracil-DNA glycosylase [Amphritea atlantica]